LYRVSTSFLALFGKLNIVSVKKSVKLANLSVSSLANCILKSSSISFIPLNFTLPSCPPEKKADANLDLLGSLTESPNLRIVSPLSTFLAQRSEAVALLLIAFCQSLTFIALSTALFDLDLAVADNLIALASATAALSKKAIAKGKDSSVCGALFSRLRP